MSSDGTFIVFPASCNMAGLEPIPLRGKVPVTACVKNKSKFVGVDINVDFNKLPLKVGRGIGETLPRKQPKILF